MDSIFESKNQSKVRTGGMVNLFLKILAILFVGGILMFIGYGIGKSSQAEVDKTVEAKAVSIQQAADNSKISDLQSQLRACQGQKDPKPHAPAKRVKKAYIKARR